VIFKPAAAGSPVATLTVVDNTVTGVNTVKLSGTATTAAIVKFTTPVANKLITSGSEVAIAVTVTAPDGPAPTGKVDFAVDGKFVASSALDSGTALVNAGTLAAGTHQVAATYLGDDYHPAKKIIETITVQ
jgi:hypothetical protein